MFDFLKRGRLIKRGLSTRKTRRRRLRSELMRHLEYAPHSKALIFAVFAAGLAILVFSGQQPEPTKNFVIALLVLATAITQLWINQPKSFLRSSRILLIFGVILVQLVVTKSEEHTSELQSHSDLVCRLLLEKKKKELRSFFDYSITNCHEAHICLRLER